MLPNLIIIQIQNFLDLYVLPKNENDNYPLNGKFQKISMNKNLKTISFAFAMFAVVGMITSTPAVYASENETELTATLYDQNGREILEASFEIDDGQEELEVEVEHQGKIIIR